MSNAPGKSTKAASQIRCAAALFAMAVMCLTVLGNCRNVNESSDAKQNGAGAASGFPLPVDPPGGWYQFARNEAHDTFIGGRMGKLEYHGRLNGEPLFENTGLVGGGLICAGGRLYVPNDKGEIVCLNADSGEEIWRSDPALPAGARFSSPRYYRGLIFVSVQPTGMRAYDAGTGRMIWEQTSPEDRREVQTTPVVFRDRIIFADKEAKLVSLDALTGGLVFQKTYSISEPCQSDPVSAGKNIVYCAPAGIVYSIAPENGNVLWANSLFLGVFSTPVYAGGVVYFGSQERTVYGLSAETGDVRFRFPTAGECEGTPLNHDGKLIAADDRNYVYCISTEDGKLIWKLRLSTPVIATMIGFDDAVFAACSVLEFDRVDNGNLKIAKARGELDDYLKRKGPFLAITKDEWDEYRYSVTRESEDKAIPEPEPQPITNEKLMSLWPGGIKQLVARRAEVVAISWDGEILQDIQLPDALYSEAVAESGKIYALDAQGFVNVFSYGEG